jgi:hypothetical protein
MVSVSVFTSHLLLHDFVVNLSAPIGPARLSVEPQVPENWTDYLGDLPYSSSSDEDMETEIQAQNSEDVEMGSEILAQNLYDVEMEPTASRGQCLSVEPSSI